MNEILNAKNKMRELALKAKQTVDNPDLTNAQKRESLDALEVDIKGYADTISIHEQVARLAGGSDVAPEEKAADTGGHTTQGVSAQVLGSKAYENAVQAKSTGSRYSFSTEVKAVGTVVDEGTAVSGYGMNGAAGAAATPDFRPGIVDIRFQRLTIADLLASGATNSPIVSYVVESSWNDNAAPVAEKGTKPLSNGALARVSDQVGKIANTLKLTDEMLQDIPQFRSFLENRLVFSIQRREEQELLNGVAYPGVTGILNRTGLLAPVAVVGPAPDPVLTITAIYNQMTNLRANSFVEPDAVVMNPTDWQNIRLAKDANKQFYGGGPFTGAYGNGGYTNVESLWGLRVVVTSAMPVGTALVGGFQESAQVFRRQGITVEMTNSNEADFLNNLIAVRAEERLALAVYRPQGFGVVTIPA